MRIIVLLLALLAPAAFGAADDAKNPADTPESIRAKQDLLWARMEDSVHTIVRETDAVVGVAILDHPANSRRAHWHVRGYGLFAANPFGDKTFVDSKTKEDSVTLEPGQKLHFRYLIVIHNGDTTAAGLLFHTDSSASA